jgi:hypothetical protein
MPHPERATRSDSYPYAAPDCRVRVNPAAPDRPPSAITTLVLAQTQRCVRRTAHAARRWHSWRAIVPTRPQPAMPMATEESRRSGPAGIVADDRFPRQDMAARRLVGGPLRHARTRPVSAHPDDRLRVDARASLPPTALLIEQQRSREEGAHSARERDRRRTAWATAPRDGASPTTSTHWATPRRLTGSRRPDGRLLQVR